MKIKYLVIGAGISGLSFASKLDGDYMIIEKESRPGGLCRSFYIDGYTWDYAGHFFHFKNEESKKYFAKVLDDEQCVKQIKNTSILYKNKMIDYPFQKNIHQLDKADFIDCLYDLFFREEKENYISFKNMLIGKFGKGICDRFLVPYNEKLYACNLDNLDKDAMGRFFPHADLEDIIRNMKKHEPGSYNDTFVYPKIGAQAVINYILKSIDSERIHLNEIVLSIDLEKKIVRTTKRKYEYDFLINTIPINEFLKLNGDGLTVTEQLSWNKVLVFNIGFDKDSVDKAVHWIYFPEKDFNFYRVGFYNNILKSNKLSIYVEIGMKPDDEFNEQEQFNLTIDNLRKCGIITDHKVVSYQHLVMNPAYVHISRKGKEFVDCKIEDLKSKSVYMLGRYGRWTYCSMEDCYISAIELAKKLS